MPLLFSILFCLCSQLCATEPSENTPLKDAVIISQLSRLDTLIEATEQTLETEKKLRERIIEYGKIQELYLLTPENNDILFRMVKCAYRTLELMKESHLTQNFDPEFVDELTVLAQAATKRGIPK